MRMLVKSNRGFLPELPSLLDEVFAGNPFDWSFKGLAGNSTVPSVNIKENDNSFELEVAAPGLDKSNFKVELEQDSLVISAQKEVNKEEKDKEGNYTRKEFSYESFQRSFRLPEDLVAKDKISARYKDGILYVSVPKSAKAEEKPSRLIEIA